MANSYIILDGKNSFFVTFLPDLTFCFLFRKDGTSSVHLSTVSNINCPQKVIRFYEERVRFRSESLADDVIAALETDSADPVDVPQDILQQY